MDYLKKLVARDVQLTGRTSEQISKDKTYIWKIANLQPTTNQGMYNFRFTILINTNNTSNYESTNETHHTQENTSITTHKGSQLLIFIETRYQLQPSNKELHTEHTPLRDIILH